MERALLELELDPKVMMLDEVALNKIMVRWPRYPAMQGAQHRAAGVCGVGRGRAARCGAQHQRGRHAAALPVDAPEALHGSLGI